MDMPSEALALQGLVDQEGLLPAPLVQRGEELGAWCCGAVPTSLLSAEGTGAGAFQTSGAGQKFFREVLARKKLFLSSPVV